MKTLASSYFALVMATGIVAIAAWDFHLPALASWLSGLNLAAYAILTLLTVLRAARYPALVLADLTDHRSGPGFFTSVAASCILGTQILSMWHKLGIAAAFLTLGIALWAGLTYAIFPLLTIKRDKPPLERGIDGSWLIAVVATQSVAVLAALIARETTQPLRLHLDFFALSMWLWGGMFYTWIIALIFYRHHFFALAPEELTPPYWINMGAMAISALAGAVLIQNTPDSPFLASLSPFLKGITVLVWATGTWWIPALLVLGIWRHLVRRLPLRYEPQTWAAVFPLGMYSVATRDVAAALDLPFLRPLASAAFAAALAAWALTFAGMLLDLRRSALARSH